MIQWRTSTAAANRDSVLRWLAAPCFPEKHVPPKAWTVVGLREHSVSQWARCVSFLLLPETHLIAAGAVRRRRSSFVARRWYGRTVGTHHSPFVVAFSPFSSDGSSLLVVAVQQFVMVVLAALVAMQQWKAVVVLAVATQ